MNADPLSTYLDSLQYDTPIFVQITHESFMSEPLRASRSWLTNNFDLASSACKVRVFFCHESRFLPLKDCQSLWSSLAVPALEGLFVEELLL